jgi:hypothetical protein
LEGIPGIKNSLKIPDANEIFVFFSEIEFLKRINFHLAYSINQLKGMSKNAIQKVKCNVGGVFVKSILGLK